MNSILDGWKSELGRLTLEDRAELARFLLDSLDPEDEGVEAAWDEVAAKRVAEVRSGRARGRDVQDFLDELRERYP